MTLIDRWCAHRALRLLCIALLIVILVLLAACAQAPAKPVTVTVDHYVAVPAELTAECPIAEPASVPLPVVTWADRLAAYWFAQAMRAIGVAKQRRDSLQTCNQQMAAIRKLGQ
jgi:hypothetical protein